MTIIVCEVQSKNDNKINNTDMVKKEINFSDGTRIFYEEVNGITQRFIEYAYSPQEKQLLQIIKDKPFLKGQFEKRVRKHNASKSYYLLVLNDIRRRLDDEQNNILYHELEELCKKVGTEYDSDIVNNDIFHTFGKYWHGNEIQCAAFFTTIYLAMLDMEKKKQHNPSCEGKELVFFDCADVIICGLSSEEIAIMSGKWNLSYKDYHYYEDLMEEEARYVEYEDNLFFDDDDNIFC